MKICGNCPKQDGQIDTQLNPYERIISGKYRTDSHLMHKK